MSFILELQAPIDSWEVAERLADATRDEGFVSLVPGRRRRWLRSLPPSIHFDPSDADAVFDDRASWDEDEFTLSERRHDLAETLLVLGWELAGTEWSLRCFWVGDEVRSEALVTASQLAERVRRSGLDRHVRYRVSGGESALALAFNEAINRRDVDALEALMSDDHAFVDSAGGTVSGKAAVLDAWRGFFDAYPDYRNVWDDVVETDGAVVATGHSVCATEPALDGPAIWAAQTRGDLVSEWRVYEDTPANRIVLGIVP